mgnify:CR=1 FL=1
MPRTALAVDVGATKVALALVDANFSVQRKEEILIGSSSSTELWAMINKSAGALVAGLNGSLIGVGIGSAGPIDLVRGSVSPVNIPVWRDFPIVERFRDLSGNQNVVLHGDAMALAHAEHVLGAGRGLTNMLGMVVSTGIGGGLILENKVFLGDTGNTSFIGHQSIDFDGEVCACGRNGCVEFYASGPRMVAYAQSLGWNLGNSFIDLAASARSGDSIAMKAIDHGTRALAAGIINTLASLDIHNVIVGGGVSQAGDIYWTPLRKHVEAESRNVGFLKGKVVLRPAQLNRDAGLIGAALGVLDPQSVLI